jgi:predicted secreted protein
MARAVRILLPSFLQGHSCRGMRWNVERGALWCALLALMLSGRGSLPCRAQDEVLILTEQDNGRTLEVHVQQSIAVQLRGNPSTGYAWSFSASDQSVSTTGSSTYTSDPGGGVGGGGTFSFPFRAVGSGETTLSFRYEQPWNPASLAQTFKVAFVVTDPFAGPRLSIEIRGANAEISWPIAGSSGYYLEGTRTAGSSWAALNALPVPEGPNYVVTLAASGPALFFRLRQ